MGLMVSEVYEALVAAGAPEDKAKAAGIRQDLADLRIAIKQDLADLRVAIKQDLADLRAAIKQDLARLESRLIRLELAVYGGGAMVLALLIKLTFFS